MKKKQEENKKINHETEDDIVIEDEDSNIASDIKKLRERLKKCTKEKEEYLDGWQRAKSDFVNSRKDQEKKMSAFKKFAEESLVYDLFPVIDSFEMAFDNEGWKKVDKTWQDGIKCLYNQFISVLKNHNVEQLEPSGKKFDLQEHESLGEIDSKSKGEDGVVIEYVRRGYKINGKVLRPAQVRVGKYKK